MARSISIVFAFAAWLTLAGAAQAAGLGRLSVLSPLGQPLNAEIEIVSVQPGEDEGLTARIAPAEAFTAAGVEVNPVLNAIRISVERRDKRPYLRLTTTQPVNEPFLDMLVELQWNTGRLVREYTVLLDPPEYRGRQPAIAAAPLPAEKPAAPEAKPAPTPAPAEAARPAPTPSPVPAAPSKPAPGKTYEVKRGDTLAQIAREHLQPGVTLNQMLIAIFRANESAFINGNINLVRTGRILQIPDAGAVGALDANEVNRIVREHRDQWNDYRARVAAAPAAADAAAGQREVAGRIEQPQAPKPAAPADQLRLSRTDPGKPAAAPSQAARGDDSAAAQRALKDSQQRAAELEKNVADLQKLLALRNQQLAEAEKKGGKPAPAAPEKPAAKAPEKPVAAAPEKPVPAPAKPEPAKPAAEAPKPAVEAPKPAAEAPKPAPEAAKPKPPAPPPAKKAPPPPEPSLIDEFLENPLYLGLLALLVVLLAGYGWWTWKKKKAAQAKFQDSVLGAAAAAGAAASLSEPSAEPITTTTISTPSPAPAPAASLEPEEVDPIAEADVYMAYGRDAQAEEILKEALQKDSERVPVHAKLLEIYAHRKDPKAFEQTALKLKGLTNGVGPEWEKAAALGKSIDPGNGLYSGAAAAEAAAPAAPSAAAPTLDFDLGTAAQQPATTPDISLDESPKEASGAIDFDLGAAPEAPKPAAASPDETVIAGSPAASGGLDFDLDLGGEEKKPEPKAEEAPKPVDTSGGLDFDLDLDIGGEKKAEPKPEPDSEATMKVDLSAISLDLGTSADATVMAQTPQSDPKWQEVATKLDLAKAYEEMGDKDGARELLKEVVRDGDAAQRGAAEELLAKLG